VIASYFLHVYSSTLVESQVFDKSVGRVERIAMAGYMASSDNLAKSDANGMVEKHGLNS
jgi:hypothetical protein